MAPPLLLPLLLPSFVPSITISNVEPRRDEAGQLFDAHDGNTVQFQSSGPYYYYAMGYGQCLDAAAENKTGNSCGKTSNSTVGVWTSPDLSSGSWVKRWGMTPSDGTHGWPKCTYYRVHAVYNKHTDKYVMWMNAEPGSDSQCTACDVVVNATTRKTHCYLAGTSASPDGPFKYAGVVPVRYTDAGGVGDFSLFVDDDAAATGYVIYKRTGAAPPGFGHRMTLQQLSADYLGVVESKSIGMDAFTTPFVEAPDMFKRKGTYYALFGKCCAFCAEGSGVGVYTAPAPLGPWATHENIGCTKPVADTNCGCGMRMPPHFGNSSSGGACPSSGHSVSHAQQNSVIQVAPATAGGEPTFVWTGDRWQSACRSVVQAQGISPLGPDLGCVKAWDYQYWEPLQWDDENDNAEEGSRATPPLPKQMHWVNEFTLP